MAVQKNEVVLVKIAWFRGQGVIQGITQSITVGQPFAFFIIKVSQMEYGQNLMPNYPPGHYNNNPFPENDDFDPNQEYQQVRNADSPRDQFAISNHTPHNSQNHIQEQPPCFPSLVSDIGHCCIPFKLLCPCLFCGCCSCRNYPLFQQTTGTQGLLQQWGSFKRILQPGLTILNPISQSVRQVSLQSRTAEYRQEGMSKDNVHLFIAVTVIYRVVDTLAFAYKLTSSPEDCIRDMASSHLLNILGTHLLQDIIEHPFEISQDLKGELNHQLRHWGLYVQSTLLKELKLDQEVEKLIESVIIKRKGVEAMLIQFRGDVEIGRLTKEITRIVDNQASYQIRYLKTLENIINNGGQHTVILPTQLKPV